MLVTILLLSNPANLTSEVQHRRSRNSKSAERAATGRIHIGSLEPRTPSQNNRKAFAPPPLKSHKEAMMQKGIDFAFKLLAKNRRNKKSKTVHGVCSDKKVSVFRHKDQENDFERGGERQATPASGRDQKSIDFQLHSLRKVSF